MQFKARITNSLVLGLSVHQLLTEGVPVAILRCLFDNNLLVVVRQLVDNVLDILVELQLVEFRHALRGDGDSTIVAWSVCARILDALPSAMRIS